MRIHEPLHLKKGDTIGIVCPAGYMDAAKAETCVNVLQQWGYKVKTGKTLGGASITYFSGTDEDRLNDLQHMLDDDEVSAVLCGRGGYGLSRIIDRIDFKKFKRKPKWIIGYSDITLLLNHVFRNFNIQGLHSPMAAAFNDKGYLNKYVQSLRRALQGEQAVYECPGTKHNQPGTTTGILVGGNLSLVVNAIGTASDLQTKGRIFFLEDIGEYKYRIDRMLQQLRRSDKFAQAAGIIFGGFTDMKDTERPFGKSIENILLDIVGEYKYPVCYHFPVSHTKENVALKIGGRYELSVTTKKTILKEI